MVWLGSGERVPISFTPAQWQLFSADTCGQACFPLPQHPSKLWPPSSCVCLPQEVVFGERAHLHVCAHDLVWPWGCFGGGSHTKCVPPCEGCPPVDSPEGAASAGVAWNLGTLDSAQDCDCVSIVVVEEYIGKVCGVMRTRMWDMPSGTVFIKLI